MISFILFYAFEKNPKNLQKTHSILSDFESKVNRIESLHVYSS